MATETLYEKIGGEKAIDAAVDLFYRKVLADGRIKHFFEGVDMAAARQDAEEFSDLRLWRSQALFWPEHARGPYAFGGGKGAQ